MKERPILFNDEMVRAILDGRKTQTRRLVKDPTVIAAGDHNEMQAIPLVTAKVQRMGDGSIGRPMVGVMCPGAGYEGPPLRDCLQWCPYGEPGDRLWVRESWKYANWTEEGEPFIQYRSDGAELIGDFPEEWADRLGDQWALLSEPENYQIDNRAADRRWRPSIHMPRWASRITLEVVSVRVERVQEITCEDVYAEGVNVSLDGPDGAPCYIEDFSSLWDSINAKRGYSWESNPWVWVVEFKRVKA